MLIASRSKLTYMSHLFSRSNARTKENITLPKPKPHNNYPDIFTCHFSPLNQRASYIYKENGKPAFREKKNGDALV